jgi:hypothetical protein
MQSKTRRRIAQIFAAIFCSQKIYNCRVLAFLYADV